MIAVLSYNAVLPSSEERFEIWAKKHQLQILERREVEISETPFKMLSLPELFFYDFTVRDAQDNIRKGWAKVRAAGWASGIEIKWRG